MRQTLKKTIAKLQEKKGYKEEDDLDKFASTLAEKEESKKEEPTKEGKTDLNIPLPYTMSKNPKMSKETNTPLPYTMSKHPKMSKISNLNIPLPYTMSKHPKTSKSEIQTFRCHTP